MLFICIHNTLELTMQKQCYECKALIERNEKSVSSQDDDGNTVYLCEDCANEEINKLNQEATS